MVLLSFPWFCYWFGTGFRANGSASISLVLLLFWLRFQSQWFCYHFIGSAIVLVHVSEPIVLLDFIGSAIILAQVSEQIVLLAFHWFCYCFGTGFRANGSAIISLVLLLVWHRFPSQLCCQHFICSAIVLGQVSEQMVLLAFHWFCYCFGTGFRANGSASISFVLLLFWHRFQSQWFC